MKKRATLLLIILYLVIAVVYGAQVQQTARIVNDNDPQAIPELYKENTSDVNITPEIEQPAEIEENFFRRIFSWFFRR